MLSHEDNDRVTRTGKEAPAGELMRRYWQPAALVEELDGDRPLKAIRLLGEDLVLFRDDDGRHGLVGRRCPHRGVDLKFARLEDGGLRCPLHGWLFDVGGRCLEQPGEPPGSNFHAKISHTAYPCREVNGIVFAYLGPGEPPALAEFDCFVAPESHAFAFKGLIECNWLQALEVGIDPAHASFLHRFFEDEDTADGYGRQFRAATVDAAIPVTKILREFDCPEIEVEATDYGLRIFALRALDAATMHVRVTNMIFPNAIVIPLSNDMVLTQWHVPIDDTTCWWYAIFTSFADAVDKDAMRRQRLELYTLPDYAARRNRTNDYGFDAAEQRTETYTGMGSDINVHDSWAVESMGAVQDRTTEHLGATDKAIIANRRTLLQAIDGIGRDADPPFWLAPEDACRFRGPVAIDTMGPAADWRDWWERHDHDRRKGSEWAAEAAG
jgi:phenylpropionate dioxygenase-like ring-hydroxylating dioxygenase large terminal subunit